MNARQSSRDPYPAWQRGDRVQVYNPGPLSVGTVMDDASATARHVHVHWDSGEAGYPQARLLRILEAQNQEDR